MNRIASLFDPRTPPERYERENRWNELGKYNANRNHGLMYEPAYVERMAEQQRIFNQWSARPRCPGQGCQSDHDGSAEFLTFLRTIDSDEARHLERLTHVLLTP